jgi:hypothetical protein
MINAEVDLIESTDETQYKSNNKKRVQQIYPRVKALSVTPIAVTSKMADGT